MNAPISSLRAPVPLAVQGRGILRLFRLFCFFLRVWIVASTGGDVCAQTNTLITPNSANLFPFRLNVGLESATQPQEVDSAVKILFAITLLTLAPSILLLMTCFTR